jgi:3-deoxy-D-manno-octulosonic-acid transferase
VRFLYAVVIYLLTPLLIAHLFWRSLANPGYRQRIGERFGLYKARFEKNGIWVHAVSVGEVQAAASLVRTLRETYADRPVVLTTMTPTGSARARDLFGDTVSHCYLPYDLAGAVKRFFDATRPTLAVVMETELWPNLYRECQRRGVPLVLANARLSPRSVVRYRRLAGLIKDTLADCYVAAQSEADAERFRSIGAMPERTHVTGNIKFDFNLPTDAIANGQAFRALHAKHRPVWIAASTHAEEEQTLLTVHRKVLADVADALLLIVPRHPERFPVVASMLEREAWVYLTRSSGDICATDTAVLLGDSMGELMTYYASADVAFVGGSLVPVGGHNLLEPAALGVPVLTGPYNFNAADVVALLQESRAAQVVVGIEKLAERIVTLLGDPRERERRGRAGRQTVDNNRGALQRLLGLIDSLV